jgi:hypothetical protein
MAIRVRFVTDTSLFVAERWLDEHGRMFNLFLESIRDQKVYMQQQKATRLADITEQCSSVDGPGCECGACGSSAVQSSTIKRVYMVLLDFSGYADVPINTCVCGRQWNRHPMSVGFMPAQPILGSDLWRKSGDFVPIWFEIKLLDFYLTLNKYSPTTAPQAFLSGVISHVR